MALNVANDSVRRIPAFRPGALFDRVLPMDEVTSRYYLRLLVKDCPGVIAAITRLLAERSISISSLIQHETRDGGDSVVVILTHPAMEREVRKAITEIGKLSINRSPVRVLRIEDL